MSEDSLEPLITQCPNCDTRFRVSESQLQIAQGRVRCGACLGVFDGTAHLSLDGEELTSVEEPADVDALLDELDEISGRDNAQISSLPDIADKDLSAVPAAKLVDEPEVTDEGDGSLPAELLALEAQLLDELREAQEEDEDSFADQVTGEETTPSLEALTPEPEPEPEPEAESEPEPEPESAPAPVLKPILDSPASKEATATPDKQVSEAIPDLHLSTIYADLEEAETPRPKRSWVTMFLILLALLGLPAQVLWFQYESWVKDPQFRPIYQTLCDLAECELPPMRDITKIVSKKSIIRTHPDRTDARIVDVLMVNNADFAQPFPVIELMATTIRGQLVAGRRFKPVEYLQGELQPGDLFPPRTPVHVSLEIQDPGEDALNFEVRFR